MNRLKNFEEQPELPLGDQTIIPLMCMASVEPVKVKPGLLNTPHDFKFLDQEFNLNFSCFKKDENSPSFLNLVISSVTVSMVPELFTAIFLNTNTEEAKQFLIRPLSKFIPFKKAILLFDQKPCSLQEFEKIVTDWRKTFQEIK